MNNKDHLLNKPADPLLSPPPPVTDFRSHRASWSFPGRSLYGLWAAHSFSLSWNWLWGSPGQQTGEASVPALPPARPVLPNGGTISSCLPCLSRLESRVSSTLGTRLSVFLSQPRPGWRLTSCLRPARGDRGLELFLLLAATCPSGTVWSWLGCVGLCRNKREFCFSPSTLQPSMGLR